MTLTNRIHDTTQTFVNSRVHFTGSFTGFNDHNTQLANGTVKTVSYSGKAIKVKL